MTPTLVGRIQTRIFLILVIGVPWTLIITPFLPRSGGASGLGAFDFAKEVYPVTFTALAIVLALGCVLWEPIYHALQQLRWERDWPSMFFLLLLIPEAALAWFVLRAIKPTGAEFTSFATFAVHIGTAWVLMWLFVVGPIRVIFPRYRFRGGRIGGGW